MKDWRKKIRHWLGNSKELVVAVAGHLVLLARFLAGSVQRFFLRRKAEAHQLALGEALFQAGLGSSELRTHLVALEQKMESRRLARISVAPLKRERENLLTQLALAPLPQKLPDELHGAYSKAVISSAALDQQTASLQAIRKDLWPAGKSDRYRLAGGYGFLILLLVGIFLLIIFRGRNEYALTPARGRPDVLEKIEVLGANKVKRRTEGYWDETLNFVPHGQHTVSVKSARDDSQPYRLWQQCIYEHGQFHGRFRDFFTSTDLNKPVEMVEKEQYFKNGRPHGKFIQWDNQGRKIKEGEYQESKKRGTWRTWEGGVLRSVETLVDDVAEGPATYYFTTGPQAGQKQREGTNKAGVRSGTWTEWSQGYKQKTETYVNNVLHGPYTEFWENGNKKIEGTFKDGLPDGTWTFRDSTGKQERSETQRQ